VFSTSVGTLKSQPESLLASYTTALSAESDGFYLVDRDPDYFEYILNWLRDQKMPKLKVI
jgi:hypothetical protein